MLFRSFGAAFGCVCGDDYRFPSIDDVICAGIENILGASVGCSQRHTNLERLSVLWRCGASIKRCCAYGSLAGMRDGIRAGVKDTLGASVGCSHRPNAAPSKWGPLRVRRLRGAPTTCSTRAFKTYSVRA